MKELRPKVILGEGEVHLRLHPTARQLDGEGWAIRNLERRKTAVYWYTTKWSSTVQSDHFRGLLLTSSTSSYPLSTVLVMGEKESSQRAWSYDSTAPAMGVMPRCHCSRSPFFSNSTQWYSNLYWPWLRMDTWPRARSFTVTLWRGHQHKRLNCLWCVQWSSPHRHTCTHLSKVNDPLCPLPHGQALLLSLRAGVAEWGLMAYPSALTLSTRGEGFRRLTLHYEWCKYVSYLIHML